MLLQAQTPIKGFKSYTLGLPFDSLKSTLIANGMDSLLAQNILDSNTLVKPNGDQLTLTLQSYTDLITTDIQSGADEYYPDLIKQYGTIEKIADALIKTTHDDDDNQIFDWLYGLPIIPSSYTFVAVNSEYLIFINNKLSIIITTLPDEKKSKVDFYVKAYGKKYGPSKSSVVFSQKGYTQTQKLYRTTFGKTANKVSIVISTTGPSRYMQQKLAEGKAEMNASEGAQFLPDGFADQLIATLTEGQISTEIIGIAYYNKTTINKEMNLFKKTTSTWKPTFVKAVKKALADKENAAMDEI